jgi:pimeloyl-ACP methyl ester carboxylesterase
MYPFQPPGFGQQIIHTPLGIMVYYTANGALWRSPSASSENSTAPTSDTGTTADSLPPLVFLHSLGGGSSAFEWSKVYPAFADSHHIIAPDLVGWGRSAHPPHEYCTDDYLDILTMLLEQACQTPPTVVATSLTAGIVLRLATQRPELFRSLFLVSPSGYGDFGQDYQRGLTAQLAGTPILDRLIYAVGAANEIAIRNFLEQFLFAERSRITDEMVAAYLASAEQPNAEYAALASLKGAICFDLSRYVGQLQTPTLMVWGEAARFSRVTVGKRLAALNPNSVMDVVEIANAGVLPHLELPAVVTGILHRWLAQQAE